MITPSRTEPTRKALLIGASRYRRHSYGDNHPLGIPRVSLTLDLIRAYGALTEEEFQVSRKATPAELEWFHTPRIRLGHAALRGAGQGL